MTIEKKKARNHLSSSDCALYSSVYNDDYWWRRQTSKWACQLANKPWVFNDLPCCKRRLQSEMHKTFKGNEINLYFVLRTKWKQKLLTFYLLLSTCDWLVDWWTDGLCFFVRSFFLSLLTMIFSFVHSGDFLERFFLLFFCSQKNRWNETAERITWVHLASSFYDFLSRCEEIIMICVIHLGINYSSFSAKRFPSSASPPHTFPSITIIFSSWECMRVPPRTKTWKEFHRFYNISLHFFRLYVAVCCYF